MDNNEFQELVLQEFRSQHEFQEKVFQKFEEIDRRLDAMEQRLGAMEQRLDAMDRRLDAMDRRLDGMDSRLDKLEARVSALEKQWQETHLMVRGLREHNEILDAKLVARTVNTATVQSVNELRDAIQAMQKKQAKADRRMFALNRRLFLVEGETETASANA